MSPSDPEGRAPAIVGSGRAGGVIAILVLSAMRLGSQGRLPWCACGHRDLCTRDAWGPHNSQYLPDPYGLTHLLHGLIFYGALKLAAPRWPLGWRFALAMATERGWELLENSRFIIDRYRMATAAQGYIGDSLGNSFGDVLSCDFGFWLAGRIGWRRSLFLFIAIECLLLVLIRDSLMLNVVMLIHPLDSIRAWQSG